MVYRFYYNKKCSFYTDNYDVNILFLEALDKQARRSFLKNGYLLLDEVLDMAGIAHESNGNLGWRIGSNEYEMKIQATFSTKTNKHTGWELQFRCDDVFNNCVDIDAQFIKNKMALRGASVKDLKTMETLMNKYFPKGLLR